MNFRTDLAVERREIIPDSSIKGIKCETEDISDVKVTRIEVLNDEGSNSIGKPIGKYITVEVPSFTKSSQLLDDKLEIISNELKNLLPDSGTILIVGIGNDDITPDALGPKCADLILSTRHISGEIAKSTGLGELRPVSAVVPGVLGKTGIETGEIISGIVKAVNPSAVITIDALAARKLSRLGCTVQMSDTGITPGSGVGNSRTKINKETIGVPVIAIGIPTVVDAATLALDLINKDGSEIDEERLRRDIGSDGEQMMVTPREIDLVIERASKLIALSLNHALQPHIDVEDILTLVS